MAIISTLGTIWNGLNWSFLTDILISVVPALLCITLHELAHGYVAYRLGDDTAKRAGRLTLNPVKHIDIMGLVAMVVFKIGWAKPVPVNMYKFKEPRKGMAITAAAGPLMNFFIAIIFLLLYGALTPMLYDSTIGMYVLNIVFTTAYLSVMLAIFNLIPIPPLDGSKMLYSFLPDSAYQKLMQVERYGMIILFGLIIVLGRTSLDPLGTAVAWVFNKLFFIAEWSFDLVIKYVL